MTRAGFIALAALLGLLLFGAGWLVVSGMVTRNEIVLEERTCAEWQAHPTEGDFRLTGCTLDLSRARLTWGHSGVSRHALVEVIGGGEENFYAHTDDPRALAIAERLEIDADGAQRARTLERFADRLRIEATIEGRAHRVFDEEIWEVWPFIASGYYVLPLPDGLEEPLPFTIVLGITAGLLFCRSSSCSSRSSADGARSPSGGRASSERTS